MKLNGWSIGVIGVVAGTAVSLATWPAVAQTQPSKKAPRPTETAVHAEVALDGDSSVGDSGVWIFKTGEDSVKVETRDGKVVRAERNGKEIPADRVKIDGGQVKILDEKGGILFEMTTPTTATAPEAGSAADLLRLHSWRLARPRSLGPGAESNSWLWGTTAPEALEPPKVMMGVTMAEPEYGLRKHCGLELRSGTMVNEVYKGLPAGKAGIEPYDVIIEADGKAPATPDVMRTILKEKNAGDEITMTVLHKCEPKRVTVKLEAYDAEKLEKARQEQMKAAGVEPGDGSLQYSDAIRGLITRVPTLDNKGLQEKLMMLDPGGFDSGEMQQFINNAIKRSAEGLKQSETVLKELNDEKVKQVEERLDRLEKMLEKLIDRESKGAAPEKPAPRPAVPQTSLPPKGSA